MRVKHILQVNNLYNQASLLSTVRDPIRTTDRYAEIDHLSVVEELNIRNWFITEYHQVKPQDPSREPFVRWLAIYQNPDFNFANGDLLPVILHQGSHDGSAPLDISFGIKQISSNSLCVVGNLSCPEFVFKHIGKVPSPQEIPIQIHNSLLSAGNILNHVKSMIRTTLTEEQLALFAQQCVYSRFDPEKYIVELDNVVAHRTRNLWKQFNHIQNTVVKATTLRVQLIEQQKSRKMKALSHIDASIKLKKTLWNLAIQNVQQFVT